MKKYIIPFIALFFVSFFTNAQKSDKRQKRGEKIKALKIAFITEELNLSTKEAEKFWPVYNKYDELIHRLDRKERFKLKIKIKEAGGLDNLSEETASSILKKNLEIDKDVYKAKIAYDNELSKVLSPKKILKLKSAEKEFIRNLMRKYRRKGDYKTKKKK